jgi:hypothetical protein
MEYSLDQRIQTWTFVEPVPARSERQFETGMEDWPRSPDCKGD